MSGQIKKKRTRTHNRAEHGNIKNTWQYPLATSQIPSCREAKSPEQWPQSPKSSCGDGGILAGVGESWWLKLWTSMENVFFEKGAGK